MDEVRWRPGMRGLDCQSVAVHGVPPVSPASRQPHPAPDTDAALLHGHAILPAVPAVVLGLLALVAMPDPGVAP